VHEQMNRKAFLAKAGAGTAAAASLPALLGTGAAFAGPSNGHRVYTFVSFSQAPASGGVLPRIGARGSGTFDPHAGWVKGGGTFVLFNQNTPGTPKAILTSGAWDPTEIVDYDTKGLGSYAGIQPAILTVKADWEGIGSGLTMEVVCNVGPAGLSTGEEEGWFLEDTSFGDFMPVVISGVPLGITHLSVAGVSTGQGA
jgi:hypothetical protein